MSTQYKMAICQDLDTTFKTYYALHWLVREKGLLALENVVCTLDSTPILFRIGSEMICSGIDSDEIEHLLKSLVAHSNLTEVERKIADTMIAGLITLQLGTEPQLAMKKMAKGYHLLDYAKYSRVKALQSDTELILFNQKFNWKKSSPYTAVEKLRGTLNLFRTVEIEMIQSFLFLNDCARREGLKEVYEWIKWSGNPPKPLETILSRALTPGFNMQKLDQVVEETLQEYRTDDAALDDLVKCGTKCLFQGISNTRMSYHFACRYDILDFDYFTSMQTITRKSNIRLFGREVESPSNDKDSTKVAVSVSTEKQNQAAPNFTNCGDLRKSYEASMNYLEAAAVGELFLQYEGKDLILMKSVPVEIVASAIHILDELFLEDVFQHYHENKAYQELKLKYHEDQNLMQTHLKHAAYLADLMMGGDGREFE